MEQIIGQEVSAEETTEQVAAPQTGYYITPEEMEEWRALKGEAAKQGMQYRKACKRQNVHPTPPSQWLACPVPGCDHKVPGSLVSHFKAKHNGQQGVADLLGVLPEEVAIITDDMMARFQQYGKLSGQRGNGGGKATIPEDMKPPEFTEQ